MKFIITLLSDDGKELQKLFLQAEGGAWQSGGYPIRDGDTILGEWRLTTDAAQLSSDK